MLQEIDNVPNNESSSESGGEKGEGHEEEDLEYLSDEGQVTVHSRSYFENGDLPAIPECRHRLELGVVQPLLEVPPPH